jgi:hypothetical protein
MQKTRKFLSQSDVVFLRNTFREPQGIQSPTHSSCRTGRDHTVHQAMMANAVRVFRKEPFGDDDDREIPNGHRPLLSVLAFTAGAFNFDSSGSDSFEAACNSA